MINKIIEALSKIMEKNKTLSIIFSIVMIAVLSFAIVAPITAGMFNKYNDKQTEIEKALNTYKLETESRIADLEKNLTFQAVFDIRNIPAKEVYMFQQKVKAKTGSMYVPMWGYCFPYGANRRFPLRIEDDEAYNWIYDVEDRPLVTFANLRFEYNIVGEIFEEPEPDWAEMGEKYNYVVPGMVGRILTSHWAVILDYVPSDTQKLYLEQQINSLKIEWDSIQLKYNPGVKNLNYVFND